MTADPELIQQTRRIADALERIAAIMALDVRQKTGRFDSPKHADELVPTSQGKCQTCLANT